MQKVDAQSSLENVLLVDDHPGIRRMLIGSLNLDAGTYFEASNGLEAVKRFVGEFSRPTLVLMDMEMPVMDGLEATRKIRELSPDTYIIIFSQNNEDIYKNLCLEAGANAFVPKNQIWELITLLKSL